MTFDGAAKKREAYAYISALMERYRTVANSYGEFTKDFKPEDSELDIFTTRDAEDYNARFTLSVLSSCPAARFILVLLSARPKNCLIQSSVDGTEI